VGVKVIFVSRSLHLTAEAYELSGVFTIACDNDESGLFIVFFMKAQGLYVS